jgi:hypothetical protein
VNSKLTVNLGLRYEWSSPYTSRGNQIQFSNFTADSGVNLNTSSAQAAPMQSVGVNFPSSEELLGTTQFATSSMRTVPTWRKDIGPRLGFAYQIDSKTVVRGGAGVYFGMSPATNFQYPGAAFLKTPTCFLRTTILPPNPRLWRIPFPAASPVRRAGSTASLQTGAIQTRTIWARRRRGTPKFTSGIWESSGYFPARSCLAWTTRPTAARICPGPAPTTGILSVGFAGADFDGRVTTTTTRTARNCDSCVSNFLQTKSAIRFPRCSIPLAHRPLPILASTNLIRTTGMRPCPWEICLNKYPQFAGDFEGLMLETANSWYNALQVRFQKRTTHHVSFRVATRYRKQPTIPRRAGTTGWERSAPAFLNNWTG